MLRTSVIRIPIITQDVRPSDDSVGYIYLTINLVNYKKYVGKHYVGIPHKDKSYLGSGKGIQNAVKKYGKNQFVNWIVDWASSEEELNLKEIQWISEFNAVKSLNFYNIHLGGEGFSSEDLRKFWKDGLYPDISGDKNPSKQYVVRQKLSQSTKEYHENHPEEQEQRLKKAWKSHRECFKQCRFGEDSPFYNRGQQVICVETGVVFPNANRAAEWVTQEFSYKSKNGGSKIRQCCKHEKGFNKAFGYHWEYYN